MWKEIGMMLLGVITALVMEVYLILRYHPQTQIRLSSFWASRNRIAFLVGVIALTALELYLFARYEYTFIKTLRYLILSWFLTLLGVIDARQQILPNKILLAMLAVQILLLAAEGWLIPEYSIDLWISALIGLIFTAIVLLLLYVLSRKGLGFGDVKLISCLGFYLGLYLTFASVFLASFFSACYGGIMMLRKKLTLKDSFPMGPFLAIGTIVTLLLGM